MDLVLVPGLNNTARTFDAMVASLGPAQPCRAVDCPPIADVDAIADALLPGLPDRFVVAGHSFGGYVALAMLARAPARVAGIVLINSGDGADSPTAAEGRETRARAAEAGEYAKIAEAASARAYHPDNAGRPDLMAERAAALQGYGPARYAAHSRACAVRPDRGALLAGAEVPKLVIAAEGDVVVPTEKQKAMAERVGADYASVALAGHMLPAEQPEATARALADWLARRFG